MTTPLTFPPGLVTPLGDKRLQLGAVPDISFTGADGSIFYLQGGKAPSLSCEDGVGLLEISGLHPAFSLLDEQGARQDGITNLDTVFDPCVVKLKIEFSGVTPASLRRVVRVWISSWNPPSVGTLSVFTQQMGEWWLPVRQLGSVRNSSGRMSPPMPEVMEQDPGLHRRLPMSWDCRGDNSFWQGVDSTSVFQTASGSGFCPLTNFGTRPAFPRFLVTGPGTFTLGNGANLFATEPAGVASGFAPGVVPTTPQPVTFGPLLAGQRALIVTLPRLRSVIDLSPSQPAQTLSSFQSLISTLLNLVDNNNTPPLLEALESFFGILPPNGPMYSLLNGRFTSRSAIPAAQDGYMPATAYIPVSIAGGDSNSQIVAAITPYRTWPW